MNIGVRMNFKKVLLLLSVILICVTILGVSASDYQHNIDDIKDILSTYNESELTGCCSVMLQLNGTDCMMSFRRDAGNQAEIFIENVTWHGHKAVKQYKTDAGYFCQVIVTEDGWTIGYGGIDDGDDNKKIENISAKMLNENNTISESTLSEISKIKASYGLGHFLIKAPNGNYGLATATTTQTGKLDPGDYVSIPNRIQFLRTGSVPLNSSDKVQTMVNLATSDGFGLTRRDVTTFDLHHIENDTFNDTVVDMYVSNDDGSAYGLSTSGLRDNIHFNNTTIKAEDIPIAPKYTKIGTIEFVDNESGAGGGGFDFTTILSIIGFVICIGILIFAVLQVVRYLRYLYFRKGRR